MSEGSDLVPTAVAAFLLGVTVERFRQIAGQHDDFPEPQRLVGTVQQWSGREVVAWQQAHRHRPADARAAAARLLAQLADLEPIPPSWDHQPPGGSLYVLGAGDETDMRCIAADDLTVALQAVAAGARP